MPQNDSRHSKQIIVNYSVSDTCYDPRGRERNIPQIFAMRGVYLKRRGAGAFQRMTDVQRHSGVLRLSSLACGR